MPHLGLLVIIMVWLTGTTPSEEPPLGDKRLSVHTLIREDVFAGVREDDADRLARGEKNIEILLEQRPGERASLLAWKAGVQMYHAVRAHEANHPQEFAEKYARALELTAEAKKLGPTDGGVAATIGGMLVLFADRLPEKLRGQAWSRAYESYQALWKAQAPALEKLPLHLQGELLGGLAQSAQRTGHGKELGEYLDKIIAVAPDSKYAQVAKQWKADPQKAKETRITCLTCHNAGRLADRRAALGDK